jgi:menaquinone-dependent protoporphyrinogen oxidase
VSSVALVAYASKHGSTTEIAEAIGAVLRERGLETDVRPAREVRDVGGYRLVVVGSALYMGKWQSDATDFLKRFERELKTRPTWLFSSGPTGGTPEAEAKVAEANASPERVPPPGDVTKRGERIGARGYATFGGSLGVTEEVTGLFERWIPRGDWRDFDAIRAWATAIASSEVRAESGT